MKEIGGYFELDDYSGNEFYPDALAVNCGRSAAVILVRLRKYSKIYIPDFLCATIRDSLKQYGIEYEHYSVNEKLEPIIMTTVGKNEAVYIVNYYGQLRKKLKSYQETWPNIIVDNAQDFFFCYDGADNLYTCRKYFGVADGAYIALSVDCDTQAYDDLEEDVSFDRMHFVLGRYERTASDFYAEASENNDVFSEIPLKKMSKLTHNLLRALDYKTIAAKRTENFEMLHCDLQRLNRLEDITIPDGAFMYPLMVENGDYIRKHLQQKKIFVPKLWPDVLETESAEALASEIVPIPCDQRYTTDDMGYIINEIRKLS